MCMHASVPFKLNNWICLREPEPQVSALHFFPNSLLFVWGGANIHTRNPGENHSRVVTARLDTHGACTPASCSRGIWREALGHRSSGCLLKAFPSLASAVQRCPTPALLLHFQLLPSISRTVSALIPPPPGSLNWHPHSCLWSTPPSITHTSAHEWGGDGAEYMGGCVGGVRGWVCTGALTGFQNGPPWLRS